MANQKLELTWIGKDQRPWLEPRILLETPARSHYAATRVTDKDLFDNRLIKRDKLLALKALDANFAGKGRCEWGHGAYSLNVAILPMAQKPVNVSAQDDLFGGDGS